MCFFGLDVFRCSQGWGSARVWALTKASHPRAHNPNRGTMSEEWGSGGGWSPTVMLRSFPPGPTEAMPSLWLHLL